MRSFALSPFQKPLLERAGALGELKGGAAPHSVGGAQHTRSCFMSRPFSWNLSSTDSNVLAWCSAETCGTEGREATHREQGGRVTRGGMLTGRDAMTGHRRETVQGRSARVLAKEVRYKYWPAAKWQPAAAGARRAAWLSLSGDMGGEVSRSSPPPGRKHESVRATRGVCRKGRGCGSLAHGPGAARRCTCPAVKQGMVRGRAVSKSYTPPARMGRGTKGAGPDGSN